MEMKFAAVVAVLALFGAVFAMGGFGMGEMMGAGGKLGAGEKNITDATRIAFMKAVHEGNYASAKALNEEYGVGGRMMRLGTEEMFSLRHQIQVKMDAGDYAGALVLQKQMGELVKEQMPAKLAGNGAAAKMGNAQAGNGAQMVKAARMGFRAGKATGGCPMAETEG